MNKFFARIFVDTEWQARVTSQLDHILTLLQGVQGMDQKTQDSIANLNAAVANEATVEQSVNTLLGGLSKQIADLKNAPQNTDPAIAAAIDQATAIINATAADAAAAVAANTTTTPTTGDTPAPIL